MPDWTPTSGDPTLLGWLTTLAYLVTGWLCVEAARATAREPRDGARLVWVWRAIALLLLGLGINKQLDLQTPVTQLAKALALRDGWYEGRRAVQAGAVQLLAAASVGSACGVTWWLRRDLQRLAPALVGVAAILLYVVVRASLFNHVELFPGHARIGSVTWLLELGGILAVAHCAYRESSLLVRLLTKPIADGRREQHGGEG